MYTKFIFILLVFSSPFLGVSRDANFWIFQTRRVFLTPPHCEIPTIVLTLPYNTKEKAFFLGFKLFVPYTTLNNPP